MSLARGEVYLVSPPSGDDPKRARAVVIVSRQTLCDSKADKVTCAPINANADGRSTEVPVGIDEGLKHISVIRGMASAAQTQRELLAKHGLAQSVLNQFVQMLDQFDAAVALGNDGRTAHVGATRDLRAVAQEIVRTVRVMDGRNRQRFAEEGQLLGSWISASTVLGKTRMVPEEKEAGTPAAGGEVRPAA
jgi:mRNA-degrading endonuclease toxin of MazEF toxin-antitoxin module